MSDAAMALARQTIYDLQDKNRALRVELANLRAAISVHPGVVPCLVHCPPQPSTEKKSGADQ